MRTLYKGCRDGADVGNLQYRIGTAVDNNFGNNTKIALMKVQKELGLVVDGSCGPNTQKALGLSDFRVRIYNTNEVWFAGHPYYAKAKPLLTLKQWAEKEKADYVYNFALFVMGGENKGNTVNYVKAQGQDIGYGGIPERMTVNSGNVCGGAKLAIKDGVKYGVLTYGKRPRNAVGMLYDGRYFQIQSVLACTESAMRDYMYANYKVKIMIIEDGGGSVGEYDNIRKILLAPEPEGRDGRPVANVVCIRKTSVVVEPTVKMCPCCGQEIFK